MISPDRFPAWLHLLSIVSLGMAFACSMFIILDECRRPQKMAVMNLVWPLTALFGSVLWLAAYLRYGRTQKHLADKMKPPFAISVLKGASHCGAGCTLGDMVVEWAGVALPTLATWFGYGTIFHERTFALWIADFIAAFIFGIGFQYWAIKPMRDLPALKALGAAIKADVFSISAWQLGMYGTMAILQFAWLRSQFGAIAPVASPEFWFAMQLAMLGGFATSYPANWGLIRLGIKEAM